MSEVTVFRDAALVRRVALLPAGEPLPTTLRAVGLPLSLSDDSVQARIRAVSGAPLHASVAETRVLLERLNVAAGEGTDTSEAALRAARNAEGRAAAECERWRAAIALLEPLSPPARPAGAPGEPPPSSPIEGRLALVAFRRKQLERAQEALERAEVTHREARRQRVQIQAERRLASNERSVRPDELRKCLELRLEGAGGPPGDDVEVRIEYLVPGALWLPSYVVRFSADLDRVGLELRARVAQHSGEDWRGVRLHLSTARSLRFCDLPELPSRRIGRAQPPAPSTGWRAPPEGADALWEDYDRASARWRALRPTGAPEPAPARRRPHPQPVAPPPAPGAAAVDRPTDAAKVSMASTLAAGAVAPEAPPATPRPRRPAPKTRKASNWFVASRSAPAEAEEDESCADEYGAQAVAGGIGVEQPTAVDASAELLDYGALRLPGAENGGRGRLRPPTRAERTGELVAALGAPPDMHSALLAALQAARGRAARVAKQSLPPGLARPAPLDSFDHTYRGRHPVDVPSDGRLHSVPVTDAAAPCTRAYVCVPGETAEVFRTAAFVNPLAAPLPEGPADIYVAGDFLLAGRLSSTPGGADVDLGLGVEPSIEVARTTRFVERTTGLLGGDLELEHEIHVELRNHLPRVAAIEVRERVPVTREGERDITVEVTDVRPPWRELKQPERPLRGGHRWTLELAPGELRTLWARYVVKLSSKEQLVGGNRREA